MARHRCSRRRSPTIVIPGSSSVPGRPVITAALVAGSLLASPGLMQMGTGDSGPLEGSAQLRSPTNALGVPRLNDYDNEGRLTLEAVPGAIGSVAGVTLGPAVVDVSPEVTEAVTQTIKEQERPSPLLTAMTFGPDEVETVKINDLGVPVVAGSSGTDSADLLVGEVVPALGEPEESGAEAEAREGNGLALGESPEGAGAEGAGAEGTPAEPGTSGAEGSGAIFGGYAPIPGSDREAERDTAEGSTVGGYAPDATEGTGSTTPCPDEEALPVSGWVEGSDGAGGSGVEGRGEAPTGTSGAEDSGSDWPVPVVDRPDDVEVDDVPDHLGPVLDSDDNDVDLHDPDRIDGDGASEPDVGAGGSGGDSPEPDSSEPDLPPVPDEVDTPVPDPEPVVDEIVDEVEEEAPDVPDSPAEDDSEPAPAPVPADDGGESDAGDDSGDDEPVVPDDLPVVDAPDVDLPEDVDNPKKVREDKPEKDKPDKLKDSDDHSGDTAGESPVSDSGEDSDDQGEEPEAAKERSDDEADEEKGDSGRLDSDSGDADEREHSDFGSEDDQSDSDSGDSGDAGSDSSDDDGEGN